MQIRRQHEMREVAQLRLVAYVSAVLTQCFRCLQNIMDDFICALQKKLLLQGGADVCLCMACIIMLTTSHCIRIAHQRSWHAWYNAKPSCVVQAACMCSSTMWASTPTCLAT